MGIDALEITKTCGTVADRMKPLAEAPPTLIRECPTFDVYALNPGGLRSTRIDLDYFMVHLFIP